MNHKATVMCAFHFKPNSALILCSVIVRVRVVLKRTVVGDSDRHFDNLSGSHHQSQDDDDPDDDFRSGCQNVSHCHRQQSFSGLPSPR